MQVISVVVRDTDISVTYGDPKNPSKSHILVATPGFVKKVL